MLYLNFRKIASLFIFTKLFLFGSVYGQIVSQSDNDSGTDVREVQTSLLPILGYTSDTGLFGGLFFQRIDYGSSSDQPFRNNLRSDIGGSLRGELTFQMMYDHTSTFNSSVRNSVGAELYRSLGAHYFGVGNDTAFSESLFNEDFYFYEIRRAEFLYRARKKVGEFGFYGDFDLFANFQISYSDASQRFENSRINQDLDNLTLNGWLNKIGIGVILDDRDSEFDPTEGFRYEAGLQGSHSLLGSNTNLIDTYAEVRHYLEILPSVVLAQKIRGEHQFGDAPFWGLSTIGDERGLRGFHLDRFRGKSSIIHILEARTWLFSIFDDEIKFGGQLFWDTGRVFSENDSNRFFKNWKHSYGFGGAISLFNPDFILRGDMGFSNETIRVYAGIGYIF